jgi:hypothetical protein
MEFVDHVNTVKRQKTDPCHSPYEPEDKLEDPWEHQVIRSHQPLAAEDCE